MWEKGYSDRGEKNLNLLDLQTVMIVEQETDSMNGEDGLGKRYLKYY